MLHDHVDIATMIEVSTPTDTFPFAHLILDAESRSVAEITDEIRTVKHDPGSSRSRRQVAVRQIVNLTITVDHRIVDGAPAARFAADLRRLLETADLIPAPKTLAGSPIHT